MRILAVAQFLLDVIFKEKLLRKACLGTHVGRNRAVVLGGVGVGLCGQGQTGGRSGRSVFPELGNDCGIILRIDYDGHALPVLGCTADHRRAADVDVLDGILKGHVRFGDGLAERIEVDADQVDGLDAVVGDLLHVVGNIPPGKKGSVDLRMEGLDPAVTDFREARDIADRSHRKACFLQHLHGTAGGEDLPTHGDQFAGELDNARLVTDTD